MDVFSGVRRVKNALVVRIKLGKLEALPRPLAGLVAKSRGGRNEGRRKGGKRAGKEGGKEKGRASAPGSASVERRISEQTAAALCMLYLVGPSQSIKPLICLVGRSSGRRLAVALRWRKCVRSAAGGIDMLKTGNHAFTAVLIALGTYRQNNLRQKSLRTKSSSLYDARMNSENKPALKQHSHGANTHPTSIIQRQASL